MIRWASTGAPPIEIVIARPNGRAALERSSAVVAATTSRARGPQIPITACSALASRSDTAPSAGSMCDRSQPRSESTVPAPVTTRKWSAASRVTVTSATMPPRVFRNWV